MDTNESFNPVDPLDLMPLRRIAVLPLYVVAVLAIAAAAGLFLLRIDRVVDGRGVLAPTDHSLKVAALRQGAVERVLVKEGQLVEAGQPLVKLDDREDLAAAAALEAQVRAARRELEEREQLIVRRRELSDVECELLKSERNAEAVGIESLRADAARLRKEHERAEAVLARTQALFDQKAAGLAELEEKRLARDNLQTLLAKNAAEISQKEMLREQMERKIDRTTLATAVETQREELLQHEGRRELAALERQRGDARARLARATILAPARGTVHALSVRGPGEIVSASNVVCRLAPANGELLAEVEIASAEIGFVHPGQQANIKLDAFPFEDYGLLPARVEYVAADADPAGDAGHKRRPVYTVRLRIEPESFAHQRTREIELRPGMTLTAELVERRETLAAMLFSPLRKASSEVR